MKKTWHVQSHHADLFPIKKHGKLNINTKSCFYKTLYGDSTLKSNVVAAATTVVRNNRTTLKLNRTQEHMIKKIMLIYTQLYNFTVSYIKKNKVPKNIILDETKLYTLVLSNLPDWLHPKIGRVGNKVSKTNHVLPKHDAKETVFEVSRAYKTAITNQNKGNIKQFRLRHRRCAKRCTITISKNSVTESGNSFWFTYLGSRR